MIDESKLKKYEWYCDSMEYAELEGLIEIFEKLECELEIECLKVELEDEYNGWNTYALDVCIKDECFDNCKLYYGAILKGFGFELEEVAE